jgi:hypothetical protein
VITFGLDKFMPMKKSDLELRIRELELELSNMKSDHAAAKSTDRHASAEGDFKFQNLANNINAYIAYINSDTLRYEFVNDLFVKSFGIRFGDRGRRFTVSDSAWLVTLCELSQEDAIRQVDWLGKFLSIRGMPTYIMEIQMQQLYKELSELIPSNEHKYHKLIKVAENIKDRREIHMNESLFETCNNIFEEHFIELNVSEKKCSNLNKNIGKLIASSIIDNKNGISDDRSLEKWLKSKETFPDNWIAAVEKAFVEIELLII